MIDMDHSTPKWLLEIEERANKVPPGPWECVNFSDEFGIYQGPVKRSRGEIRYKSSVCTLEDPNISELSTKELRALGKFIAASRSDIPRLVETLKEAFQLINTVSRQMTLTPEHDFIRYELTISKAKDFLSKHSDPKGDGF
jgi:hypothetical protein